MFASVRESKKEIRGKKGEHGILALMPFRTLAVFTARSFTDALWKVAFDRSRGANRGKLSDQYSTSRAFLPPIKDLDINSYRDSSATRRWRQEIFGFVGDI
jgi:hypothetical protein